MRRSICRRRKQRTLQVCAPGATTSLPRWQGAHAETVDAADGDAVALESAIESVAADAELCRCVDQVAVIGADDLQQGFPLGLGKGVPWRILDTYATFAGSELRRQIVQPDLVIVTDRKGTADDVAELADVTRPVVLREAAQGLRIDRVAAGESRGCAGFFL